MARAAPFDPALFRLWAALHDCARAVRQVTVLAADKARIRPDDSMHVHAIPTVEAALAGVVRITASGGEVVDLHAGDVLVIHGGVWHQHAPLRSGAISYHQGVLGEVSDLRLVSPECRWEGTIPQQPSAALIQRLLAARSLDQRRALAAQLLGQLELSPATESPPAHPGVEKMWRFMRQHRHRPIKAADVIRASGLKASHAHALFRREFGETPKQALLRDRLLLARAVLKAGGTLTEAAQRCGFTGSADLSRAFRRRYGLSPRAWVDAGAPGD